MTNRQRIKRNQKIKELYEAGMERIEIAIKFQLSERQIITILKGGESK